MESLDERYRIERELGRGGMGQVFLARDLEAGERLVALKVLTPSEGPAAASRRSRFQREGEALARFRHPNVVAIHGVGEARGRAYLVLDYVEGEDLADRLERDGPLPSCEAAELVRDLADAMAGLHAEGVLHRDIKPANVLIRSHDGLALLTDFGLAVDLVSDATRLTQDGSFLGTPGFMSPEQASGRTDAVSPATDVYGLGALLYCALTGRPPLEADDLIQALVQVLEVVPARPSERVPTVDRALDRICARCLAKDPAERFPYAGSLRAALDAYLSGAAGGARTGRGVFAGVVGLLVLGGLLALAGAGAMQAGGADLAGAPPSRAPLEASPTPTAARDAKRAASKLAAVLAREGVEHSRAGRFREAIESFTRSIEVRPHSLTFHNRANAKQSLNDMEGALEDLGRSIERKARSGSLGERAVLLVRLGRFKESLPDFARSLELKEDPDVLFHRGEALRTLGRHAEALADARRLRAIAPRDPLGYVLEARVLEVEQKSAEALAMALAGAEVGPDDYNLITTLARLYLKERRWQECTETTERFLLKLPNHAGMLRLRGIARLRLGDMGGREDLEKFLELVPDALEAEMTRQDLKKLAD